MNTSSIITTVVTIVVKAMAEYGANAVKWDVVTKDVHDKVCAIMPGTMFDEFAAAVVGKVVVLIENLCKDPKALADIEAAIEKKDYKGLITALVAHSKQQLVEA